MPGWAHAEQSIANSQALLGKMAKQVVAYARTACLHMVSLAAHITPSGLCTTP